MSNNREIYGISVIIIKNKTKVYKKKKNRNKFDDHICSIEPRISQSYMQYYFIRLY